LNRANNTLASEERHNYSQILAIQSLLHQNREKLMAAIINFMVHSKGLPFSIFDKPTSFMQCFMRPVLHQLGTTCLTIRWLVEIYLTSLYETYFAQNPLKLNDGIEMYIICLYGDSATIKREPFLNILAALVKEPSIVLEISDATDHLKTGNIQDSTYVASHFLPWCNKLDPEKKLLDCVFFDGADDVQKAGKLLAAQNAEHVVLLFCKDVAKLTPIHIVVLKCGFLYQVLAVHQYTSPVQSLQSAPKDLIINARLAYSIRQIHIW
jgi:hypothetical protein